MATKLQRIYELSQSTTNGLCSYENWIAFLRSAAWQYKYPFEDQVLIFAQRPDAKACADFDTWNGKHFRRRINAGAKGIALLRENGNEYYLDHVFDVSDTNRHINGIDVKLWQYDNKYYEAVTETLQNRYGDFWYESKTISDTLLCTGQNIVLDNKEDYLHELKYAKENSFLADYDDLNIDKRFQQIAETSVAYMTMVRMGIEPDDYIVREDFEGLWDFNTPETMSILGGAVSSFAEEILREVQSTITAEKIAEKNNEKFFAEQNQPQYNINREQEPVNNETERTDDNDRNHIQDGERDTDTKLHAAGEPDRADRQIRDDAEEIPDAEPPQPVLGNDDTGNTSVTPLGNRQDSERASGTDDTADGESRRDNGETESGKPDEVDRTYEQPQTFRRRGSGSTVGSQLSLFDLIEESNVADSMAREAERLNNIRPAFSISQEIIDKVLSDGTNERESLLMISAEFSKNKPLADKVAFLKDHYGIDGKGFIFDERKVTAWWNKDGMRISYGSSTRDNFTQELSWEDVARRIDELLDVGRFAPTDVLIQIPKYLYNRTADRFWDMRRDMNFDEYPELNELFTESVYNSTGSYPDNVSRIEAYLKTPNGLNDVNELMKKICELYDENTDIVRFRGLNNPYRVAQMVEDLYIPRKEYTAENLSYVPPVRFISEDEIDNLFRGGTSMQDGRYRVYNYFAEHPDKQERIAFLKKEYGTGGSYNGKRNEDHDAKGIRFSRGQLGNPLAEVHIKWNEAEKRIDKLIKQGRYLTEKDIKNIPDYERKEVAAAIYYAFHNRIQDGQYRPYPSDMNYYGDAMKVIDEKIKSPVQMEEIFEELNILLSETLTDDRDYEWRIRARDTLEKYMEGNFNLFPGIDRTAPNSVKDLKEAMRVINEYSKEEFEGDEADFSDLTSVSLAFTETEDGKHFIDVEADLINHKIIRNIDNKLVEELKYSSLSELIEKELYGMSFDDLIYFTDEQLAPFYQSPDSLMEEANMLQDFFIYSKADDIAVSVQNETVVAADGENEWKGKEIYDFILNEMLAFNEDGTLADGLTVPEDMLESIKKTGVEKYGVEYAVIIEVDEPKQEAFSDFLARIHAEDDEKTVALLPLGDFYESYGSDAEAIAETLGFHTTHKTVEGVEYALCGFPKHRLEENVEVLTEKGFDVILVDDDGNPHKIISRDKALGLPESTAPVEVINAEEGEENPVALYVEENEDEFPVNETAGLVGKEITIDDRKFIVDSINEYGSVSLKDITFENGTGFPIFRRESVEFVKATLEQQKDAEKIVPDFERVQPSKVANTVVYPEIPMSERRNFAIDNDELGYGGAKEKFRKNMEAIRVLKECESEHRLAMPQEQEILSEYVGWGGLADAFDDGKPNWSNEYKELSAALTPDEYEQARASTLNAHYTSPTIIKAMYKALENTGFTQGNILEPSCGIGNFMGLVPDSMSESKIYGIEIDSITGRIAQQLYQKNSVAIQGYEDTTLPDSFFDVAIGNVPFGDYKVADKKYNKHNFLIHDYFFAKTLDKVRPGGIVAFITSSGTMDKKNSNVRKYIAQRADLIGAVRLPNNAFKANAGTEVTADILFLQIRDKMTDIMPDWVHLGTLENGITVNQYFADNPDMILGSLEMVSGPFGPTPTCTPYEDESLANQLDEAIQNIHATISEYEYADVSSDAEMTIPADPNVKNFSYAIVDGNIYFRENSTMRKVEMNATAENRIKGMVAIRDCVRQLIDYQKEGYSDYDIKEQQEKLNRLYDDFTKKYGLINSRGNAMAFSDDSSYFLLCSLEVIDENGELERKADMFTKRTIGAKQEIKSVDTASEALAVSLSEKAKVDMDFMMSLTGKTEDELVNELKGVIFLNYSYVEGSNIHDKYLTADEFLSGNVRDKYKTAKWLAEKDDRFKPHAEALEKVQPQDLTASEITVRLGSTWIPPEYIKEFTFELLGTSYYARQRVDIKYSEITGEWNVSEKSADKGIKAVSTYGTSRASAYKIIEETLNLKDVRIFDYHEDENGKRVAVLNRKETTLAQQKQDLIKAEFDNWIWKSPERRERLTTLYNERFNSNRPREYDGSHINFSGMNPEIELRQHQKNAVARIMYGGNSLLGHVVGAGKTWTMVAAAMESKRLGLCNKSLFVVPNHLTEQWASEFLQLYPAANILVATKKDFETKNRKKFCGRIATGDYDAVIIGHSQFEKIPMSVERQRKILEGQLKEIMDGIIELKAQKAERYTVKQLVKSQRAIQGKLAKLNDQSRKDDVVTFEELGVDRIFIDEAHYYKNLYLYTKMRNVGGIAQTEAQKSSDLFMKTQYLDEITGNKGVIFATGTPVSNSMVELYTMQRYLQYKALQEKHLQHFDAWASTFGETITAIELAPEGTGYRAKTRFAKFFNLPELMSMFKDVADIQTADMLNLPTPIPHYKTIAVEPTEIQKEMVKALAERAEDVRDKKVDPTVDNMLKITNDGRKLALDQRLINPLLPDDENSKVSNCAREVFGIWQQTADKRSTQLVFCDLSTPKDDGNFDVYNDIRNKLIKNGVPDQEIEFIHKADTEVKKKELFSKVRKGDVRILLGSTPKMGAGTNVQRLLYASHDLDCPWRPADLERAPVKAI